MLCRTRSAQPRQQLPEGTPVVELTRTTSDENGRPVEVLKAIAADMITFSYDFPIPD